MLEKEKKQKLQYGREVSTLIMHRYHAMLKAGELDGLSTYAQRRKAAQAVKAEVNVLRPNTPLVGIQRHIAVCLRNKTGKPTDYHTGENPKQRAKSRKGQAWPRDLEFKILLLLVCEVTWADIHAAVSEDREGVTIEALQQYGRGLMKAWKEGKLDKSIAKKLTDMGYAPIEISPKARKTYKRGKTKIRHPASQIELPAPPLPSSPGKVIPPEQPPPPQPVPKPEQTFLPTMAPPEPVKQAKRSRNNMMTLCAQLPDGDDVGYQKRIDSIVSRSRKDPRQVGVVTRQVVFAKVIEIGLATLEEYLGG